MRTAPEPELLDHYPQLHREDMYAAFAYGAEMSRERFVKIPSPTAA